jgi:LPS export ABC transporter protein LptC
MRGRITLRSLVGVIILGTLGGAGFFLWEALSPVPGDRNPPVKADAAADLKLDRVHYTETREGTKEWELEAASAVFYRKENSMALEKVRATFYGKNEEIYALVGEKGRYNTETKVIEVYDGVVIDSNLGYRLRTQSLRYRSDQKELTTSDPVELSGPDMEVEGVGMVVDLNRQHVTILGGVTTTLSSWDWKKPSKSAM